jgi:hypothetical protein
MTEKPPQDPMHAICGARTRSGAPCRGLPMPNGRCRMHGGCSTGPRTREGVERLRDARTIHGAGRKENRELRDAIRHLTQEMRRLVELV